MEGEKRSVVVGEKVPPFSVVATGCGKIESADLRGKNLVLYFYPKDNTPGCTIEGCDFRDNMAAFAEANTVVYGVSCDTMESHEKFKAKKCFPFELISDSEKELSTLFDVLKTKSFFGKKFYGIVRSTFLIDSEGVLRREWRNVSIRGHVAEVLEAARQLV